MGRFGRFESSDLPNDDEGRSIYELKLREHDDAPEEITHLLFCGFFAEQFRGHGILLRVWRAAERRGVNAADQETSGTITAQPRLRAGLEEGIEGLAVGEFERLQCRR